ncbi:MAG: histidinol-phosphate transaminase [Firmicutes bacterium HGW-Firmicutes-14]|jgi:histidinol-phosphate aminotransferase|nr:MAG: histidinol-phosphate transaminase [Firmicutes bacterium HGW-Firmicutes-14]
MDANKLMRDDLKDLVPYEPHPYSDVIKLDANENPHEFPPEVLNKICFLLKGEIFTRYPDPMGDKLRGEIAKMTDMGIENIILGNGSDELIQLILQTFGGPGKRVVIPAPTFAMYKIHGQITGTRPVEVLRNQDFSLNIENLLKEMRNPETGITFIASPNNPTGTAVPPEQIESITRKVESLVVVDEAYIDFGGQTCLPLVKKCPNLIILRTFSKIALAGLRVGYLLAHRDVVVELTKVKQPYNVNAFSQMAAVAVLDNWPLFRAQIEEIKSERVRLETELEKIDDITVIPSQANFILFRVRGPAGWLHSQLLEKGILVRKKPGVTHGLEQCLRVTVGTREENDMFLEKIKEVLIPQKEME